MTKSLMIPFVIWWVALWLFVIANMWFDIIAGLER